MEIDTAMDKSFFFALLAAPTAMATEVPQTEVAVATVITPLKLLRCYQFFLTSRFTPFCSFIIYLLLSFSLKCGAPRI